MATTDDPRALPPAEARLAAAAAEGCPDARLLMSRRALMGIGAALFSTAFLPDFARADSNPEARFLVVMLRGGMDGINLMIPKLDPRYREVRRGLAIPFAQTLSLGSDFGLHPGLERVHNLFGRGQVALVPAAGIPLKNRSHFECQDNLENGLPANVSNATGWLNRLLGSLPAGDPIRERRGLEIGDAPLILQGPEPVLGWSPTWFEKVDEATIARLQTAYGAVDPALWDSLARGLEADRLARDSGAGGGDLGPLRQAFIGAARLMRAETGPRIAVLSIESWDTHSQQGGVTGYFNDRLRELDQAIGDLRRELEAAWDHTVVVCVTEFGRTVLTNGDRGTDHGIATVALMAGGAVRGGIYGDWPGLGPKQLYEGDLRATVDLRSVFKGIAADHLGVPPEVLEATVFPDSADAPLFAGLIEAPGRARRPLAAHVRPPTLAETAPIALYRRSHGL